MINTTTYITGVLSDVSITDEFI